MHSGPKEVCLGNILFSSVNIFSILLATDPETEKIPFFFKFSSSLVLSLMVLNF